MDIIGILVLVISFFFLLVVGVPVAYSIGVAGIMRCVWLRVWTVSLCWRSRFLYWRGIS